MPIARRLLIANAAVLACCAAPLAAATAPEARSAGISAAATPAGSVPFTFEPSGPDGDTFIARGDHYAVAIDARGVAVDAGNGAPGVRVRLASDTRTAPGGEGPGAMVHRLVGPASAWRTNRRLYSRVRQARVWPGIDIVYYGAGRQLEWDYIVAPGADPDRIAFGIEGGVARIDADGDLVITAGRGELRQRRPVAYQVADTGTQVPYPAHYEARAGGQFGIRVDGYDPTQPLVIDPVLVFSTYLGGTGGEFWVGSNVAGIALDTAGNVVVCGDTATPAFPGVTAVDLRTAGGARDLFVARFSSDGTSLQSLTFLGGNGLDDRASVAVGSDGAIYVAARTLSTNLAASVYSRPYSGGSEAVVYKLDATASAVSFVTYVGGAGDDMPNALTLDALGRPVIAGSTTSTAFPVTSGAPQTGSGGGIDAVLAVLDSTTGAIAFASYLGGTGTDEAFGVQVNDLGQIFVAGSTQSIDFPTVAPLQAARAGPVDAFVAALAPGTSTLLVSTYFGGAGGGTEFARGVAIGPGRSVYVVGVTDSASFPVSAGAAQTTAGGLLDGFAARLAWNGASLSTAYSTFLGGAGNDAAFSLGVTTGGSATITGATQSPTFPPDAGAFDRTLGGTQDAYVATLNPTGTAIVDASFVGGSGIDVGLALALDGAGDAYVIGQTSSVDLPTAAAGGGQPWDAVANGGEDAFVFRTSTDLDRDGLPDSWERRTGLDPTTSAGDNGGAGDPDRDQLTNLEELDLGTNPLLAERFFAEGAIGTAVGFDTRFAVLNPWEDVSTDVTFEFMTSRGARLTFGPETVLPGERLTLRAGDVPGLAALGTAEFATEIRSRYGVVADRTMTWGATGYGSHAETSITRPSRTWYLAEGATHSNFSLFYLLQNLAGEEATVRVTYLRPAPKAALQKTYTVPARSRFNIWVNEELFPAVTGDRLLASEELSAVIDVVNGPAIIAERAMYQTNPGQPLFSAGHESAAVREPSARWFLAEGATNRDYFSEFILIANPSSQEAIVTVTYLLESGQTIVKQYGGANATYPALGPQSRTTIWVNLEDPRLADAAVSAVVECTNGAGLVVERAMWWPAPAWVEGHNSAGTTTTGTVWALAEGELGGPRAWDTYILIANTSAFGGRARVTLHYEDGTTEAAVVQLAPSSRRTVGVGYQPEFTRANGQRFGATVEALPDAVGGADVPQIVVERAMYSADTARAFSGMFPPGRPYWPAGNNAVGTKLQ